MPRSAGLQAFAVGTASSLGAQGAMLLFFSYSQPSYLSMSGPMLFFVRAYAVVNVGLAALTLLLTGTMPLGLAQNDIFGEASPYAHATVVVMTTYHIVAGIIAYTYLWNNRDLYTMSTCFFSILLACVGIWILLFGDSEGRVSKTTGADKHTSNFPFSNKASASAMKKEFKTRSKDG